MSALASHAILIRDIAALGRVAVEAPFRRETLPVLEDDDVDSLMVASDEALVEGRFLFVDTTRAIGFRFEAIDERISEIVRCLHLSPEITARVFVVARLTSEIARAMAIVTETYKFVGEIDADTVPMAWMNDWPVELAELRLAAERGVVAATMLSSAASFDESFGRRTSEALVDLWLEGLFALLRLTASCWPDVILETLIPPTMRVDIAVAYKGQGRWNEFLLETASNEFNG